MNYSKKFLDDFKLLYDSLDIQKIENDIKIGNQLLKKCAGKKQGDCSKNDQDEVLKFIFKIIDEYQLYINLINRLRLTKGTLKCDVKCNELNIYMSLLNYLHDCKIYKLTVEQIMKGARRK